MRTEWKGAAAVVGGASRKLAGAGGEGASLRTPPACSPSGQSHRARRLWLTNRLHLQSILYGSKVQHLVTSDDPFAHDLYRSTVTTDSDSDPDSSDDDDDDDDEMDPSQPRADPRKGTTQAPPRTNTAWLASVGAHLKTTKVVPKSAPKPAAAAKSSAAAAAPTATDAALAQLTGALASESQKKQDNT